jgi:hypothetical protein
MKLERAFARSRRITVLVITLLGITIHSIGSEKRAEQNDSLENYVPVHIGAPLARDPIVVYNNWSAYDELSDNIPLTEQLAMKELDEVLRLRRLGLRFDYYTIDAFWFDPDGG